MKYICKQHRNTLVFGVSILAATLAFQTHANPFNDGTTNNITSDTTYNETLIVGVQNPDNTLIIESNATVHADNVVIGQLETSTNNLVSVVGDSLLVVGDATTNGLTTGGVVVGDDTGDATLNVQNASTLDADDLYVGFGTNDSGTIELLVDGTNVTGTTEFNVANDAYIGYAGSTNSVNVGDQSALNIGGDLYVGFAGGSNNTVTVNGGSLFVNSTNNINVVDPDADNSIDIQNNGTLQVGGDVETGTLEDLGVNFEANAQLEVGGTLTLTGNTINDSLAVILNNALSTNTATWSSSSFATIGGTTSGNSLTITNGADATSTNILQVGSGASADNNALVIGGTGSTFIGLSDVMIGAQGDNNEFAISDGGEATIGDTLYLGNNSGATGNEVTVGSNGVLNVGNDVVVGDNGSGNTFTIADGQVGVTNDFILGSGSANNRYFQTGGTNTVAGEFIIGRTANATGVTGAVDDDIVETTGNLAIIGTNAVLNIEQGLTVGQEGGGSIMTLRDGGIVNVASNVVIGEGVGDNYIYLQRDSNTLFRVAGDLIVGKEGGSNRFAVYGGTADIDGNLYMGASTNQHEIKNFIHLETTNAVLNVANGMYIGASNSINTLDLVGGAKASAQDLFVGAYDGVSNNVVTVTGTDSLLSVSNRLEIGSNTGSNNAVNINNGGTLFVLNPTNIVIGATATNDLDNRLNINSGGTLQTIDWDYATVSTNIALNSGSTLELDGIFSGTNQLDGGIELALNGAGAATNWNTEADILRVGYQTGGNSLTTKEGGLVTTSTNLIVGSSSKSANNTLTATGLSSRVEIGNNLIVGHTGSSGNAVKVLGGGRVDVGNDMVLGYKSGFNSGSLIEGFEGAGSNSVLDIAGKLTIGSGENGNNNALNISSNATVNVGDNLAVGSNGGSENTMGIANGGMVNVANNLNLGTGGSDNTISIRGLEDTPSSLNVTNNLIIGSNGGDGNTFTLSSNATANVFNLATIGSSANNNTLRLEGTNAVLNVGSNLLVGAKTATGNKLDILEGTANVDSGLIVGSNSNSANNTVLVSGSNSTLNVGGNLVTGENGSGNSLSVSNGAMAHIVGDAWIGLNSANNWIEASGSNSQLVIDNDLYVGSTNETSSGNRLDAYDGAYIPVGGSLSLATNGSINITYDSRITVGGDYEQDEFSTLNVSISTNSATTNLVVDGTANLEKDTTIAVFSDGTISKLVDEDGNTNELERTIVAAGSLKIDAQDATTALLHSSINFQTNALLGFNYTVTNNTILLDNFIKRSWAEAASLEDMLADVANEIEGLTSNELAQAMDITFQGMSGQEINKAMNDYYGEKMSSIPTHNVINQGIGSIASELTGRGDNTRDRITAPVPGGAAGPHRWNQELQGWIAGYGTLGSKSEASGFDGYDVSLGGFIIGADFAASENLLLGVAGGSNSGSVDKDNGAGGDTKTTYGAVYASLGTKDWFLDGSVIYGTSSIDYTLGSVFDTTASYDAKNIAVYLGGGKEIVGQYLIITPQASLLANQYKQDAYDEKSSSAVARSVDDFDALYLRSSLGCSLGFYSAMGTTVFRPELRAHWLHEFNDDEESLSYLLIGGDGNNYNMLLQAPDSDILKLGTGFSAKMSDYLELRADIDARLSAEYSDYTFTGSLRYQF